MEKRMQSLSRLWKPFLESSADAYAAGACFFIALGIFPTLLIMMSVLPLLPPVSIDSLLTWLQEMMPEPIYPMLKFAVDTINENSSIAILSVSTLVALWAASRSVLSVMDGMRVVLGMPQKTKYFVRRLYAIGYFLLLMGSFSCMLILYVFGSKIHTYCITHWPDVIWLKWVLELRNIYPLVLFSVLSGMVYRLVAANRIIWRWCMLGGTLTSVAWWLISMGFSLYVDHFAKVSNPYGAIGTVIMGGIWLYVCLLVFLYNGLFCYMLQNKTYHPVTILRETFRKTKPDEKTT